MSVAPRQRKNGIVYYVANKWNGKVIYEPAGKDEREAKRKDARMKKEIAAGTFSPKRSGAMLVGAYADGWLSKRKVRTVDNEVALYANHVVRRCPWFIKLRLEDVRPVHYGRLVDELAAEHTNGKGVPFTLAPKSVALIAGIFKTMFRDARIAELMTVDPCVLPTGKLSRKVKKKRLPYAIVDALKLVTSADVPWDRRIFNAMAFYTGLREGEICGRRWRDLDVAADPLACLVVETQYDDQPLKTDDDHAERPRKIPVHPELLLALEEWKATGFELVYRRLPTDDDFIVPRRDTLGPHTKSSAYKAWRRSCVEAGVMNRSLHSTRHTFISQIRRGGARTEVAERITHNAEGKIIDQYTHWEWAPLCEAMLCLRLDARLDPMRFLAKNKLQRLDSNLGEASQRRAILDEIRRSSERIDSAVLRGKSADGRGNCRTSNRLTRVRGRFRDCVQLALSGSRDGEILVRERLWRLGRLLPAASRLSLPSPNGAAT